MSDAADRTELDIAVIGGGPAGLAASLWAARYRRRVALFDAGEHRNRWSKAVHGYLGMDGRTPQEVLGRARHELARYPEVDVRVGVTLTAIRHSDDRFDMELSDGCAHRALRVILCTGVRDVFPPIDGFENFFGTSIFSCPSCDGYESQGKSIVVIGDDHGVDAFAIGLLHWASSVTLVVPSALPSRAQLEHHGIRVIVGNPRAVRGHDRRVGSVQLFSGQEIPCQMVFCTMEHRQQSDLARDLGCDISPDGCVQVDDQCRTSVERVYAAGDMTPGPHLVQVAASKGATAGIAAATSLRGGRGAASSPLPAPDADQLLEGHA